MWTLHFTFFYVSLVYTAHLFPNSIVNHTQVDIVYPTHTVIHQPMTHKRSLVGLSDGGIIHYGQIIQQVHLIINVVKRHCSLVTPLCHHFVQSPPVLLQTLFLQALYLPTDPSSYSHVPITNSSPV